MSRSKFSNYKRHVRHRLVFRYEWSDEEVNAFFKHSNDYLYLLHSNSCSVRDASSYINANFRNKVNVKM